MCGTFPTCTVLASTAAAGSRPNITRPSDTRFRLAAYALVMVISYVCRVVDFVMLGDMITFAASLTMKVAGAFCDNQLKTGITTCGQSNYMCLLGLFLVSPAGSDQTCEPTIELSSLWISHVCVTSFFEKDNLLCAVKLPHVQRKMLQR